jgi:hypothetical protein
MEIILGSCGYATYVEREFQRNKNKECDHVRRDTMYTACQVATNGSVTHTVSIYLCNLVKAHGEGEASWFLRNIGNHVRNGCCHKPEDGGLRRITALTVICGVSLR